MSCSVTEPRHQKLDGRADGVGCKMMRLLQKFVRDDKGQDLIEYAFLAAFIALFVLVGVRLVGTAVNTAFQNIADEIPQ